MCESKAVEVIDGKETVLMEDIVLLKYLDDKIVLYDIRGKALELPINQYIIDKIDFLKHKIYFVKK